MNVRLMSDLDMRGKTVVFREDLNVPVKEGKITSDKRIRAAIPSLKLALEKGAGLIVLSHLGRPEEGVFSEEASLAPVAKRLEELLGVPVRLVADYLDGVEVKPGECVLCENVRFNKGEKKNNEELARKLAALGDIYVMDAFATAHRAQASTEGAIRFAKTACVGLLMAAELEAVTRILHAPKHPLLAIIGGSKVSTKLEVLNNLSKRVDKLIVGGGIANTFLKAAGFEVGKSLCEDDLVASAAAIMAEAKERGAAIPLPVDVVVGPSLDEHAPATVLKVEDVRPDDMILDIGPDTATPSSSPKPEPWSGTAPWARLKSISSARAPKPSPRPSRKRPPTRSPAAATASRPSKSTATPVRWTTSPPRAARSSKCSKARPCPPWRLLRRVRHRESAIIP